MVGRMAGGRWGMGLEILWIVLFGVCVATIPVVIWGRNFGPRGGSSAHRSLEERCARGEIGKGEFERKRRELHG